MVEHKKLKKRANKDNAIILTHFRPAFEFGIETNHSICSINQITSFYMKSNTGLK